MAKTNTSPDDQLTTQQAAAELGITPTRVLILLKEGRLPATRFGWAWIIRRGDLDAVRDRPTGRPRTKKKQESKKEPPAPSQQQTKRSPRKKKQSS